MVSLGQMISLSSLACVDEQFSKPFMTNLGKDAVYNFMNNMLEKSEYCRYT